MTPTMPELGWSGTVGVTVFIMLMVAGIVLYHLWMDRRLKRDRERLGGLPCILLGGGGGTRPLSLLSGQTPDPPPAPLCREAEGRVPEGRRDQRVRPAW